MTRIVHQSRYHVSQSRYHVSQSRYIKAGHSIKIIEKSNTICVLHGTRKDNGDDYKCSFSLKDAEQAGLANRDVWKKYTVDMLYNRCMSRLARTLFPDVIGNAYVEGEVSEAIDIESTKMNSNYYEPEKSSKPHFQPPLESETVQEERISGEQVEQLKALWEPTSKDYTDNFFLNVKHYYKIDVNTLSELPLRAYTAMLDSKERNIQSQKEQEQAALQQ